MIVYVITAGEYSEYHICAVTLYKEKAEYLKKLYSDKWDAARIQEFDTEENPVTCELRTIYHLSINEKGRIPNTCETYLPADVSFENKFELTPAYSAGGYYFSASIAAQDMDHATKTALDKRAEMIADATGLNLSPPLPMAASSACVFPDAELKEAFFKARNC